MSRTDLKFVILIVGVAVLIGGVILVDIHQKKLASIQRSPSSNNKAFELRKQFRRSTVGYLIICLGLVISGCYWVREGRAFVIIVGMMLLLILLIMVLAFIDMISIGLKLRIENMTKANSDAKQAVHDAIAKHQQQKSTSETDSAAKESSAESKL